MKQSLTYRMDLIHHLVWRDFTLRYQRSVLGILWSLLFPLAQLLVLVFLFDRVLPLRIDAYPAFVFSGLLPWVWFSNSLSSAGNLFVNNRDLVRRPNFEPATLVAVNALSNLIHFLMFLPILLILLLSYGRPTTASLLLFPLLLFIQGLLIVGLSLIIATMNVFYQDVGHIVNLALMLLFYLTPVFYQSQAVGDKYRFVYTLNPIASLIQGYRGIFFYGVPPDWGALVLSGIVSATACGLGYFVYGRQLDNVIDTL